jgi:predicted SprT family Zn-dependent metalloprotease
VDLQELDGIAKQEMEKHGLRGWTFGWANTKRRLGACKYRVKRIEISKFYALHNPLEKVFDTLLHEIAHALAGPKARHGPVWKAVALRIGATPRACDTSHETIVTPGDWQAICSACQKTFHRYRRPQSVNGYRCRCPARLPLTFQFVGDPARKPEVQTTIRDTAKWEAKCEGCQTVHLRNRKPKAGVWHCRCPQRCKIIWRQRIERRLPLSLSAEAENVSENED